MIDRRFFISGFVTTAAIASVSKLIPAVAAEPQPYATVYGVGWDNEVIEHVIYQPMSVAQFGGTPAIDKFREVTAFVHAFPVEPMPNIRDWIWEYEVPIHDPLKKWSKPVEVQSNGFTNIVGYQAMDDWRDSLRPDLDGHTSVEWVQEQLEGYRKFGGEPPWLTDGLKGKNNV